MPEYLTLMLCKTLVWWWTTLDGIYKFTNNLEDVGSTAQQESAGPCFLSQWMDTEHSRRSLVAQSCHICPSSQRERQEITLHHTPLPLPFQWPGLSLWQVPSSFLSIISPPFAHPHGPVCHCGRSRLSTNFPHSLPSHLYPQPSVIPTFKARLVIVAGPASSVSPHFFLSITPIFLFIWLPCPQAHDTACYCCKSHPSSCFPPHSPHSHTYFSSGGTSTKHVTSLGMSKATHEFLTLHYFALDSAEWWEQILGELLPNAQFPAAVIRRTIAYQMFMAAHIAPSHRRPPHPVWEDSLSLIADLLFGNGMDRYVGAMQRADSPLEVNVRGFSAGSYSGLAFLHILWSIPRVTTKGCLGAIACPPSLLSMSRAKREDRLHLIHFESDSLCSWKPGPQQIRGCCTSFTYITNEITSYKGHFGPDEHDYSHWMALELPHGSYALRVLLFIRPEAASKARRDATPLRLISWLSYKLNPELEQFIEKAMEHLSTWTETEGGKVLTMGKEAIPQGETINSEVELRNQLIDLISVGNLKHKPQALFTLFRQFLTRISLPRLIHFMDLVLPQLTPVQAAWAGEEKTLWSCHHIRWLRERQSDATPRVQISYFFSSHDNVHHVRIQWNSNPLLLFSDPTMVEALPVEHFGQQASHMTHQQHLQMGLRKGMAILIYYVIENTHYQAVLLAEESVMNRGRRGENRLWKRVTPSVTEFAWLPPNIAESFCKNALYRDAARTYCAFDTPHLGLDTKNFVADVFVENILYLGDTRSADDLSVFTKMAPERLCLGCGLRVDEPFAPISTGERKKLFYAAQKLLTFVLHEVSAQTLSEEEAALQIALRPLITNKDGHFVAAVTSMYQSLLEGKTDCPISGVFGAGKTLSAAAMIAGLLVMDPSLTIMIVTKENVAAHAFVKHFLRLGLPESINCLVGRLVGSACWLC